MADVMDVARAVRDAAAAALAGAGMVQPAGAFKGLRLFVGWPDATLDADLAAGVTQVTVWPLGTVRNIGPYLDDWREDARPAPSLTVTVGEEAVTLAGNAGVPGMVVGVSPDGRASASVQVGAGDTPATVAAALAAALVASWPGAAANGATLALPGARRILARVGVGGAERKEARRVQQSLVVTVWAPTAALRDQVARVIDDAFMEPRRLPLPDGTSAFVTYVGTGFDEEARKAPLHRRDLTYQAEFSAVRTRPAGPVVLPDMEIEPQDAPIRRVIV